MRSPRVLVVTNMWPGERSRYYGLFVAEEVESVRAVVPSWSIDVSVIAGKRGRGDYITAAPRLRRLIRRGGYDLVHAHYGMSGLTVALAGTRVPMVLTLHGGDVNIGWQRAITRLAALRAAAVITVSEEMRRRFLPQHSEVLPCGVRLERFADLDRVAARRQLGIAEGAKLILFPADPSVPVKNYPLFASAMEGVRAALGVPVLTETLNDVDPAEVPARMAAADIIVLTSHSEGSPMVVKEALAAGRPVISVDVGDVRSLLAGVPGCAVVERNPEAVAMAVCRALNEMEPASAARIARLRELQLDAFSTAARLVGVYERALGARTARV